MDVNQNNLEPEQVPAIPGDIILKDDIPIDSISEEIPINTEQELQLKIDELEDALDDIAIKRQNLYNQKKALDQQAETLHYEKKSQQKLLSRLQFKKAFSFFMFNLAAITASLLIFGFEFMNYHEKKNALDSDYNNRIATLDRQEQADRLASQKDHVISQSELSATADTILSEENREELDAYIASLNRYHTQRVSQKEIDGISYYEVVQKYDLGQYMLSDSGNPVIYPGAILRGDSLMQGTSDYSLVSQERTPITLVCNRGGSVSLEDVSYGTVSAAVKQLWDASDFEYAQKWEYTLHSIQNEESLNLSLGIGAFSTGLSFDMTQTETTSTMAITFTETYFSVSAEPMQSATQYFQTGCDLKNLGNYEPAYVSSVDYGRMIVILVTTELTESELKAKLAPNLHCIDIGADIGYIQKEIDAGCKIYCYGGDSAKTLHSIDNDDSSGGLKGWWNELINGNSNNVSDLNQMIAADDSFGNPVPLAYHLNYLSDNSSVPAVAILNDNIILKETARLVTLTLEGNLPGIFRLSPSADAIGYVVNTNQIQITKKGETSGEIQFIWDSSNPASLTGFFNDSQFSCSLAEIPPETDHAYSLDSKKGPFSSKSTDIHIYISDAIYEIP